MRLVGKQLERFLEVGLGLRPLLASARSRCRGSRTRSSWTAPASRQCRSPWRRYRRSSAKSLRSRWILPSAMIASMIVRTLRRSAAADASWPHRCDRARRDRPPSGFRRCARSAMSPARARRPRSRAPAFSALHRGRRATAAPGDGSGCEVERELQIDERRDPRRRGGRPRRRARTAPRRRRLAANRPASAASGRLDVVHRLDDQRMVGQHLVEVLVDLQRVVLAAVAREPAGIGLTIRSAVGSSLVGALEALAGLFLLPARSRIRPAWRSLKIAYQSGPATAVDACRPPRGVAGALPRPRRQQRRGQVGDRPAHRLRKFCARGAVMLHL